MKIKKTKRGFTIVELVIVIAVIGVLTAILVPTFINLTAKANKASDNSLVANLNTALKMQEGEATDKKNETMHDAVEDLDNYGYNLTNLVAKSSDDLLYSLEENRFYLSDAEQVKADLEAGKGYKYWHIQDNLTNPKGYSIYAGRNFGETTVSVTAGFDAGDKTTITSVTYDRHDATVGQDVVIRTNSAESALTVNAPLDTVHHFDYLDELTITAVAGASYHEHGKVNGKAVIAKGHIEIEKGAEIPEVSVENATGSVKVTANEKTTISVDETSKASTSIIANSKNVYVDGAESSAISGSESSSVKTPTLITTEALLRENNNGFAKLGADIVLDTNEKISVSQKCVLDLNGHNISVGASFGEETDVYDIAENGELTIKGLGKITANSRIIHVNGSLRVESGTLVSTAVCDTADLHSGIISEEKSSVVINGGSFYSAKCTLTTFGDLLINGGEFVSIGSTKLPAPTKKANGTAGAPYAYTIRIGGKSTINGGSFYGIQGAISVESGDAIINDCYAEASAEALSKYAEVQSTVHTIFDTTKYTGYVNGSHEVNSFNATTFLNSAYYALYAAGEAGVVTTTINGGEFVNKGPKWAVHVGNSTLGDGGMRLNATVVFNGGKFVAEQNASIISVDYYVGTVSLAGGNYNKNQIRASHPERFIPLTEASEIISEGYRVVAQSDGTWSIVK